MDRRDLMPTHVGYEQFYRVGADINDGAAHGFHALNIKNPAVETKVKIATFCGRNGMV
jgi:hypothetical protein